MKNQFYDRRQIVIVSDKTGISAGLFARAQSSLKKIQLAAEVQFASESTSYKQQPLTYVYNALEPINN